MNQDNDDKPADMDLLDWCLKQMWKTDTGKTYFQKIYIWHNLGFIGGQIMVFQDKFVLS